MELVLLGNAAWPPHLLREKRGAQYILWKKDGSIPSNGLVVAGGFADKYEESYCCYSASGDS